jgi:hypothetical protein
MDAVFTYNAPAAPDTSANIHYPLLYNCLHGSTYTLKFNMEIN